MATGDKRRAAVVLDKMVASNPAKETIEEKLDRGHPF
jgi:hypothetical protein